MGSHTATADYKRTVDETASSAPPSRPLSEYTSALSGIIPNIFDEVRNMNRQEVMRNCWLIVNTAGRWLAKQDDLTKTVHQVTVEAIQDATEAPLDLVLYCFEQDYPRMWKTYGKAKIERVAAAFLDSEFEPMSTLFDVLYAEFNTRYFAGRLAPYRVKVMHNIPFPSNPRDYTISCIDKSEERLSLVYDGWPEEMLAWLLRLMAHIQTVYQGVIFENELARLSKIGAPTQETVARLKETGWNFLSTVPWYTS
jgi:hypothetical protein